MQPNFDAPGAIAGVGGPLDAAPLENPFVGLRPFESKEALLFFGRDEQTTQLMQQLHLTRFLAVVGSSGCGKSSLIRAGLIPKLKAGFLLNDRGSWRFAKMKPGMAPLQNLAAALLEAFGEDADDERLRALSEEIEASGVEAVTDYLTRGIGSADTNVFLLVDQFEEIFRFGSFTEDDPTEDSDEREQRRAEAADFVSIMLTLARTEAAPVYVVMTMRSDFLGDCDAFQGLPEAMNKSQYLVPRLTRPQRLEAIQCPPRLRRKAISPELAARVLNDMGEDPDQLPVMQHALMRTWEKFMETDGETLTVEHYEAIGTIKTALSKDADKALEDAGKALEDASQTPDELKEKGLNIVRLMFQALVEMDAKGRRLRRPVQLSDLQDITGENRDTILTIVECFRTLDNRSFLILSEDRLSGDLLVDISHESLIRQWGTLGKWVDDEIDSRELYLRVAGDAIRREVMGKAALWRDPNLQPALDWRAARQPNAAWALRYRPKLVLVEARRRVPDFEQMEEQHKNPEFAFADKFLKDSRELREHEEAEAERERLRELATAQAIAHQREVSNRRLMGAAAVMAILMVIAFATAVWAYRAQWRAKASETKAKASETKAKASEAKANSLSEELEGKYTDLKRQKAITDETLSQLKFEQYEVAKKTKELEDSSQKLKIQTAAAVAASLRAQEEAAKAEREKVAADKARDHAQAAQAAGGNYRNATKARRESRIDDARGLYLSAVSTHQQLGGEDNRRAQADNYAELGNMLVNSAETPAQPAVAAYEVGRVNPGEAVQEIVSVTLGKVPQAKKEIFDSLKFGDGQRQGLEYYGEAVKSYRALNDFNGSAALVEEVFEFLSPSAEGETKPEDTPTDADGFLRTQAAIKLFCGAREDFANAPNPDRHISMLLKIGHRLDTEKPSADDAAQATRGGKGVRRSDGPELEGCPNTGSEPPAYFDEALGLHEQLIGREAPAKKQERREKMVNSAVSIGESYLAREDTNKDKKKENIEHAKRYFERAKNVYLSAGSDPSQREPRAALLVRIGGIYLADKDAETAKQYFQQAEAVFPNAADAEQRKALVAVLVKIGEVYGEKKDNKLSDQAAGFYDRAADLLLRANDPKSTAPILESIGDTLDLSAEDGGKFYLLAADEYAKANLRKEEADVRLKAGRGLRLQATRIRNPQAQRKPYEDSLAQLKKALDYYVSVGARKEQVSALTTIAPVYVALKRPDEALTAYNNILRFAETMTPRLRGDTYYGIGRAEALKGQARRAEAEAAFAEAIKQYTTAGYSLGQRFVEIALKSLRNPRPASTPTPTPPATDATPEPTPAQTKSTYTIEDAAEILLAGEALGGQTPKGSAEFALDGEDEEEFTVTVENVNLPAGTVLDVLVDGKSIGQITLDGDKKRFKLKLEEDEDETIPALRAGSRVTVVIAGQPERVILAGTFPANASPTPSPTPR